MDGQENGEEQMSKSDKIPFWRKKAAGGSMYSTFLLDFLHFCKLCLLLSHIYDSVKKV